MSYVVLVIVVIHHVKFQVNELHTYVCCGGEVTSSAWIMEQAVHTDQND